MAFVPRNFEQILNDMIAHMRANTTVTDFTVGSVIRTLLEACALEDDEQYYQMVQLLDAFRIATASGVDLDERAADLNLTRLLPTSAVGTVVIMDGGLVTNELMFDVSPGGILYLQSTADFPAAPFDIRVGEGTPQVEDCSVTYNNTTTNTLTVAALLNYHSVGDRVSKLGGGDKVVAAGVQIQVPASGSDIAVNFSTLGKTTIADGNYSSSPILTKATTVGKKGNVPAGKISQFQGSPPFVGALVSNTVAASGGRDLETDAELRSRLLRRYRELSRGTVKAIESAVIGVTDETTGQSIVTAKLREDLSDPYNHILYVDDGSGFAPSKTIMPQTVLSSLHLVGVMSLQVSSIASFSDSGYVMIDPTGTNAEYVAYTSLGPGNVINLATPTTQPHAASQEVLFVELLGIAEEGQNFFQLANWPILRNSLEIYDNETGSFEKRIEETDYFVNKTNGNIQYLGVGLSPGTVVLAHYIYYTGLLALVQKVVTGDPTDRINYPGVVAGGIIVHVNTPVIRRISVSVVITAKNGYDEIQLRSQVQRDIEAYIDGLFIGDNVYRARIIEKAVKVTGVENAILTSPTADIVILENELPSPYDVNGDSLIQVL